MIRVGMARKRKNSVAALRDKPKSMPPMMVAPDLEVPGMRAKAWAIPSFRASSQFISVHRFDADAVFRASPPTG